ncbi:RagB/SusD family nutrient uptake outer membrane protein [Bacteroides mediterraneensis]|uniref:RagB/SusD family nutrient uptake outer membrane protein n=2 Tax=Bacteroides mediterraneensis TaxID=1841856 RepID=A0ABS2EZ02_9BACE|nr:RagB/SusD family nutrient uptake outer membrane protein [Bacteroides mediterraneensis]
MNSYIKVFATGLLSFMVASCSLDEVNYSAESSEEYIKSETQYEELVSAAYMRLRPLISSTTTDLMWYGTDIYSRTGEMNDAQMGIDDYSYINTSDASVYDFWCKNYDVITQANTAMTRGENLGLDEEIRTKRTAELLVLRAYAYFNLVETYGGVPLLLSEITEPTFSFTRVSEEEVYDQIISDLEEAISSNGLDDVPASNDFGRVGLGMAKHLLGKALLTRSYKSFAKTDDLSRAITYFNDVIALHPMVGSWDILFDTQTGAYQYNNSEVIFSVRYSSNQLYNSEGSSGLYQHFLPALFMFPGNTHRGAPYWRTDNSYRAGEDYLNSFEDGDIRNSEKYLVRNIIAGTAGSTNGHTYGVNDVVIYCPKEEMTDTEINQYQADHPSVYLVVNPDEYNTLFPVLNQNVCYPFVYKFYDPNVTEFTDRVTEGGDPRGSRDIYIFRTAETKLLLAEAYLKNNQPAEALEQVNDIRRRANASELQNVDLDVILDESGRELFGEANRWMDLKRTGKLFERAYKYNKFVQRHHNSASDIDDYFLLRPIPQTEIDRSNNTLEQNPGYAGAAE